MLESSTLEILLNPDHLLDELHDVKQEVRASKHGHGPGLTLARLDGYDSHRMHEERIMFCLLGETVLWRPAFPPKLLYIAVLVDDRLRSALF